MASKLDILGWLISGMLAGITYVYPDYIRELIDSVVPNAGFYVVRAVFLAAIIYFAASATRYVYRWRRGTRDSQWNMQEALSLFSPLHSFMLEVKPQLGTEQKTVQVSQITVDEISRIIARNAIRLGDRPVELWQEFMRSAKLDEATHMYVLPPVPDRLKDFWTEYQKIIETVRVAAKRSEK